MRRPLADGLTLIFQEETHLSQALALLKESGVPVLWIGKPKSGSEVSVDVAEIKNKRCWHIEEALTELFAQVEGQLETIRSIAVRYGGTVFLDLAFDHFETYPSLVFSGENMKKIRALEADIGIDPY